MKEIGIKLADGSFYQVLSANLRKRKIELTTVRDNQETVQIDLFRKNEELEYIGSLIIEDIARKKAGEATIDLNLEVDDDENLKAEALDSESGAKQALKVSLATLDPNMAFTDLNMNDFSLLSERDSSEKNSFETLAPKDVESEKEEFSAREDVIEKEGDEKKKFPRWAIFLLCLLGIVALIFAVLFLTRSCSKPLDSHMDSDNSTQSTELSSTSKVPIPSSNELEKTNAENETKSDESNEEHPEIETVASDETKTESMKSEDETSKTADDETTTSAKNDTESATSSTIRDNADGSVRYKIKWGDTLWDLAESFYKDPWKFRIIADYNKIANPNYIIAGTYIDIPAK